MILNNFDKRLEILIKENNTKKKDLAVAVDLSPSMITDMVKGRGNPSLKTIKSIANYYHVSEEWLAYGAGEAMADAPKFQPEVFYEKLDPAELELLKLLRESPEIQTIVKALGVDKEAHQDLIDSVEAMAKLPKGKRKKHLGRMFEDLEEIPEGSE